ncbi:hypothetical protein BGZ72_006156 [Mortierella alpina]|nr:hypothetical protein BGZ72_006156 [Mortierella alpina]
MTHKVYITDKAAVIASLQMSGTKAYGVFQINGKSFTFTFHDQDEAKTMALNDAKWFLEHLFADYNGVTWLDMEQTLYFGDRVVSFHIHPHYL